jgi:tRNA(adenine34) deaminase
VIDPVVQLATDRLWMQAALDEAAAAGAAGEVPVGCVVVHVPTNRIVGRGQNVRERQNDPTGHAEIVAIRTAGETLASWRLIDCCVYVTLEPCPMCAGAIVNARAARLVYSAPDPKAGAVDTLYRLCNDPRLNHRLEVTAGVMVDESVDLLQSFFRLRRAAVKNSGPAAPPLQPL